MVRSLFWFGLYLALVLAPLCVAALADPLAVQRPLRVELAVALGFVAFAVIVVEFALVSRLRAASEPFGTDALMLFHRHMGLAALAFACAHVALLWKDGPMRHSGAGSGALAAVAAAALVVGAVHRRRLALRYESWKRFHTVLALAVVAGMLAHTLSVDRYSGARPVRAVLLLYVGLFLALMFRYRVLRPLSLWRRPWEVVLNRAEGGDTRTLVLRPVGHDGIEFEPGQFAWLITGTSPFSSQQHPLTISSSAELAGERTIELSIKALGDWSGTTVPALTAGVRAWVDGPFGAFTLDRARGPGLVMIAGGIGVTPMRSMLLTMRDRKDVRPVLLILAARNRQRAVFLDELEALAQSLNLRVVSVFEERAPGWDGECGFVTAELLRRHLSEPYRRRQYFVCGPGPMMDAVEEALAQLGVPSAQVRTERFDMV